MTWFDSELFAQAFVVGLGLGLAYIVVMLIMDLLNAIVDSGDDGGIDKDKWTHP